MSDVPTITRRQPGPVGNAAGITSPRASARRVDITPELGIGMAGHGPDTDRAHGAMGRLWANMLVVDDGKHERVALITIDMMAGSRFLSERLAERVAAATGLSVERIFLAGSHTHRGPGWVWGNATYDRITATADLSNWDSHYAAPRARRARPGGARRLRTEEDAPGVALSGRRGSSAAGRSRA